MAVFRRRHSTPERTSESTAVIDMMVEEARTRLDRQFSNNDAHDVKAGAALATAALVGPVVITFHTEYGPTWPVPVVASILVASLALATIWPRRYSPGPRLREFYDSHGGREPADAARQLFSELLQAHETNEGPIKVKLWLSRATVVGLFLIPAVSAICWVAWH